MTVFIDVRREGRSMCSSTFEVEYPRFDEIAPERFGVLTGLETSLEEDEALLTTILDFYADLVERAEQKQSG